MRYLAVALALAACGGAWAQPQPEYSTACSASARLDSGLQTRHTTGCDIGPLGSDVDAFVFSGMVGDTVRLTAASTSPVGPALTLTAPGGGVVATASCPTGPCAATLDATLAASGDFTVTVGDTGADTTGAYVLELDRLDPRYCAPVPVADVPAADTLDPVTDVDVLRLVGRDGDTIRLAVETDGGVDLRVELLSPAGLTLRDESCSGPCTVLIDETLTQTGTFRALVSERDADETGSYTVTSSCLAGACLGDLLVDGLAFGADPAVLSWDAVADLNATYEVSRGVLADLRVGGSFAAAGFECLGAPTMMTELADTDVPASGQGFVYAARAVGSDGVNGLADDRWGPAQVCGRELASCMSDPGRSCSSPIPVGPGGLVSMDNSCGAPNAVDTYFDITNSQGCSGVVSGPVYPGPEVIYAVDLGPGNDIVATLTPNPGSDLALFVIAECGVGTSCVAFKDQVGSGLIEEVLPGPLPEGTYYLYVDSYYSAGPVGCGDFTLSVGGALDEAQLVSFAVE